MKVIPSALAAHYATRNTTLACALKITRPDGQIFAFTTHDVDDEIDGILYRASPGLVITTIEISSGAAVGNLELTTLHDGTLFTTADVMNGLWRNSEFLLFRYNYRATAAASPPVADVDKLLAGTLGEATIMQEVIRVELRDLRQYLQQPVGPVSSKTCRARLGDAMCGVRLDPPAWEALTDYTERLAGDARTGSVVKPFPLNDRHFKCVTPGTSGGSQPSWNTTIGGTTSDGSVEWETIQALTVEGSLSSATSNQVFTDSARAEAAGFFDEGSIEFVTGDNAGVSRKIKQFTSGGTFTLAQTLFGEVNAGDDYIATAGCHKRQDRTLDNPGGASDCIDGFDNVLNFQGEPNRKGLNNLTGAPPTGLP